MFEDGIFGGMFDLDGDGKLDSFEQTLEFIAISELMEEQDLIVSQTYLHHHLIFLFSLNLKLESCVVFIPKWEICAPHIVI